MIDKFTLNVITMCTHLDMTGTEEKLTIKIRFLNEVMVSNGQFASHAHPK